MKNKVTMQMLDEQAYERACDWPPDVRAQMEAHPERWAAWQSNRRTIDLIRLKRHEVPDSQASARCRVQVREALERHLAAPAGAGLWAEWQGTLRWSVAAVLVLTGGWAALRWVRVPGEAQGVAERIPPAMETAPEASQWAAQEDTLNPDFKAFVASNLHLRVQGTPTSSFRLISMEE